MSQPTTKPAGHLRPHWLSIAGLFAASWFLTSLVLCFEIEERLAVSEFNVGDPAPRTIFSSLGFSYENKPATQALRDKAAQAVPPVYRVSPQIREAVSKSLNDFFTTIENYEKLKTGAAPPAVELPKFTFEISKALSQAVLEGKISKEIHQEANRLIREGFRQGLFDPEEKKRLQSAAHQNIALMADAESDLVQPVAELFTADDPKRFVEKFLSPEAQKNKALKNLILDLFSSLAKANAFKDDQETLLRQSKAAGDIQPVEHRIKKNELVVQRGLLITSDEKTKLDELSKALTKHKILNQLVSIAGFVFIIFLLSYLGFYYFAGRLFFSFRQALLFHTALLVSVGISKTVFLWPGAPIYFMPTALAPLLLVLLAGAFPAVASLLMMTGLVALLTKFNMEIVLATLVTGCAAILAGQKIRKRIQLVQVGGAIGFSYLGVLFFLRIFYEAQIQQAFQIATLGFISGVITIVIGYLLASLLEVLFNLTTDIYLLEMSDLNHPLLKRMIVEAPGTYHHSLVVSTLAEAACEEIGANALLARVGCYFHDIGKIAQAEYFTENSMATAKLRHDALTPGESFSKIRDHVKGGIELGKKFKLKKPILDFIPEHQGTGVVYYFYRKALDDAKPGQKIIDVNDFRYPGPKPQSRETAVALLADSTEAASRSLKDPNPDSIRRLVRKIINDKFIDAQLDECSLTLQDLFKIQNSFVKNLMAIFHTRVAYPEKPASAEQVDIFCDQDTKFQ